MKKQIFLIFTSIILIFTVNGCKKEEEPEPIEEPKEVIEAEPEEELTEEELEIIALVEHLVEKGYDLPIEDRYFEETLAKHLGAVAGYRYYDLETLETTEIYIFDLEDGEDMGFENVETIDDEAIEPNLIIDNIAVFSTNTELIKDLYFFVREEELPENYVNPEEDNIEDTTQTNQNISSPTTNTESPSNPSPTPEPEPPSSQPSEDTSPDRIVDDNPPIPVPPPDPIPTMPADPWDETN